MNSRDVIVNIKNISDIKNITGNTKYINLSLDSIDNDVINYFLLNGKDFSYADTIDNRNGFIYASYDTFKDGEYVVSSIINNMPDNLNDIEKVRYIYISLGKFLYIDINTMHDKNEIVSFNKISTLNNIWGSLSKRKVGETIISKIFMYICLRLGIKCELICSNIKGDLANKVYIDNNYLIVDLFNDLHNIQGGFSTKYFDKYNDIKETDRKIFYIKDEYMDFYIEKAMRNINYNSGNVVSDILTFTSNIMYVGNIGTYELYRLYRDIFDKYIPNYDVKINNLFVYDSNLEKEHFTLFSYDDNYYSFNYNSGLFIKMDYNVLYNNFKSNKIGIYDDEVFELEEKRIML